MNNPTILFNEKSYIKYFQEIINTVFTIKPRRKCTDVYTLFPFD